MSELIRCFVAASLDSAVARRLEREIGYFQLAGADVKWVHRDNFHLTLNFLGSVDPEVLMEAEAQLEEAAEGIRRFRTMVRGIIGFPDPEKPRIIAASLEGDIEPLEQLHRDLRGRFRKIGVRGEKKTFNPHITMGRVRGDRHFDELQKRLVKSEKRRFGLTSVRSLVLFMSDEGPRGPIYTPLKSFSLL